MGSLKPERSGRPRGASGFTLIELLVALFIATILIGLVSVSTAPRPERALRQDAERLAHLLTLAREVAQLRGRPIRFVPESDGFAFLVFMDRQWQPLADDADLRPRRWAEPTQLRIERADGQAQIEFGRDQVDAPYRVFLQRPAGTAVILANGLGRHVLQD